MEDPQTGKKAECEIVISKKCPVNLLGKDLLHALDITIIPVEGGLKICRSCEAHMIVDNGEPYYWYVLNLCSTGPGCVQQPLLKQVEENLRRKRYRLQDNLHCTMYFKQSLGPDPSYEKKLTKFSGVKMTLKNLYWDQEGNSVATCLLPDAALKLYRGRHIPHVSITRSELTEWYEIGESSLSPEQLRKQGVQKYSLNWVTQSTPGVHLSGGCGNQE